jgi:hypothetical protein
MAVKTMRVESKYMEMLGSALTVRREWIGKVVRGWIGHGEGWEKVIRVVERG